MLMVENHLFSPPPVQAVRPSSVLWSGEWEWVEHEPLMPRPQGSRAHSPHASFRSLPLEPAPSFQSADGPSVPAEPRVPSSWVPG